MPYLTPAYYTTAVNPSLLNFPCIRFRVFRVFSGGPNAFCFAFFLRILRVLRLSTLSVVDLAHLSARRRRS